MVICFSTATSYPWNNCRKFVSILFWLAFEVSGKTFAQKIRKELVEPGLEKDNIEPDQVTKVLHEQEGNSKVIGQHVKITNFRIGIEFEEINWKKWNAKKVI